MRKTKSITDPVFGDCVELTTKGLRAVVAPQLGMSLVDFTIEGISILDKSGTEDFLECRKGLGPLILPHFNQEGFRPAVRETDFFHLTALKKRSLDHPFQHGLGRYMPWRFEVGDNFVVGRLSGKEKVNGFFLKALAGFDFEAEVCYSVESYQLLVSLDVQGEKPVAAGIHFYYDLVNAATATVTFPVGGQTEPLVLPLNQELDNVYPVDRSKEVIKARLLTDRYSLETLVKVQGEPEERFESLTIYSPANASFVCVEPLSHVPDQSYSKKRFRGAIALVPAKR
ncbi:MAG: hypothetical protein A2293_09750 [Elusimicrobia bacterium RIFOXYB2_FULL_49_7]|nr:MAG: hypothetical protein A2293_09750 [Elusimicrobia bacterium RIFOXYB2_FULL_49_7]